MAEKVIKIDEQEIKRIKDAQSKFLEITNKIGEVTIQLEFLAEKKQEFIKEYSEMKKEEKLIIDDIAKKYGYGRLNIDSGELTIIE